MTTTRNTATDPRSFKPTSTNDLLRAAKKLRQAQRNYMADRGNQELGKAVALAATKLDEAIEAYEKDEL